MRTVLRGRSSQRFHLSHRGRKNQKPYAAHGKIRQRSVLKLRDSVAAFDNRYTRLHAPKGALKCFLRGDGGAAGAPRRRSNTIREIPISRLPLRILPFLLPSRFCESDRLAQFAKQEFGKLLARPRPCRRDLRLDLFPHRVSLAQQRHHLRRAGNVDRAYRGLPRFRALGYCVCRGYRHPGAVRELLYAVRGSSRRISMRCSRPISAATGGCSIRPAKPCST